MFTWVVNEYNVCTDQVNDAHETPLIIACREGKLNIVQLIIENYSQTSEFNVDHKSLAGWTAFMFSSVNGYVSISEYLLKNAFSDLNMKDKLHRNQLHWATKLNNLKMIEFLL